MQTQECRACGLTSITLYMEERRGALEDEIWRHEGNQVNREDYARMRDLMEQCHDHKNRKCTCATHRRLREVDPLTLVSVINSFRVEWVGP